MFSVYIVSGAAFMQAPAVGAPLLENLAASVRILTPDQMAIPYLPDAMTRALVVAVQGAPTLALGQSFALNYVGGLQIKSGPLTGAYFAHINYGIFPGTGGPGQPKAILAHEVDPWLSTEAARSLLLSGLPLSQTLAQAIRAAQAFLNTRTATGDAPPIEWVDVNGKIIGTTSVDAADSAYSSFLRLVAAIYKTAPNDPTAKAFLNTNRVAILNVADKLALLSDTDGLFWTFPPANSTYKMKLLAGNCEDVAAMFAVSDLATNYYADAASGQHYGRFATSGKNGIFANFYNSKAIGQWYISKDVNGTLGGLTQVPNWNAFDMFLLPLINCNVVAPNSADATNIINFLFQRHPNVLTSIPSSPGNTALTYTPEFGLALVLNRRLAQAKVFSQTVVNAEFPTSSARPDGYFTCRSVGQLVWLIGLTK